MKYTYSDASGTGLPVLHTIEIPDADLVACKTDSANADLAVPADVGAALAARYAAELFPAWRAQALDPTTLRESMAAADAARDAQYAIPRYVAPGGPAVADAKGGIMQLRASDGAVLRNGIRMGANAGQMLLIYGDELFVKGKTTPLWWKWTGSTWASIGADFDAAVFK